LAVVVKSANHGNEIKALDPLRGLRYPHVMSITRITRYTPAAMSSAVAGVRRL
jgi:hypothetical protein